MCQVLVLSSSVKKVHRHITNDLHLLSIKIINFEVLFLLKDYSKYSENIQLRLLITSYTKLCALIKVEISGFFCVPSLSSSDFFQNISCLLSSWIVCIVWYRRENWNIWIFQVTELYQLLRSSKEHVQRIDGILR